MIHLYYGEGKGKTTAAAGLALRASGAGRKVLFVQFFKDGESSEVKALRSVDGVDVLRPTLYYGRYSQMTDAQRAELRDNYTAFIDRIIKAPAGYDMIVLDEIVSAYGYEMFDREELLTFLKENGQKIEIVLTGRYPLPELVEISDYVTEMKKIKHPFDSGITAREGVEY